MDNLKKLFDTLVSSGLVSQGVSFESFVEKYNSDKDYQEKVFAATKQEGLFTKSRDVFFSEYSPEAPPVNEPEKKKAGLTGMESSSEDGSLGFTASEGIYPEYLKPQPKPQSPYQPGMEPGSYGQKQLAAEQAMEDEYQAARQQTMEEVAPVLGQLQPEQLAGKGPVKPSTPEQRVDTYFKEQEKLVSQMTDEEIAQAYYQSEVQLRNEDPRAIARGVPADKYVPDYIKREKELRDKKKLEYKLETESMAELKRGQIAKTLKEEEDARRLANQAATQNPEFASALSSLSADLMAKTEEEAAQKLNSMFGKFGLYFEESGFGTNYIIASTRDGKSSIEIPVGYEIMTTKEGRLKDLTEFIYANALPPEEMDDDFIANALKAKKLRSTGMKNPDGTTSTVKFVSVDNMAIPTLFPKGDKYSSDPKDWIDFGDDIAGAIAEAQKRGEVFRFKTAEDANRFAAGEWKDVDESYLLGKKYYAERGLDYVAERRKYERFNDVQDEIDVINSIVSGNIDRIPYSERSRFPQYFGTDGRPLYHAYNKNTRDFMNENLSRLSKERDILLEQVYDNEFMQDGKVTLAREGFDLELEKKRQEVISEAVKINSESKEKLKVLNDNFEVTFGVPITEISKVVPKTPKEAETIDVAKRALENLTFAKQNAAAKFEEAKTYLDAKWNKQANKEYIENLDGWWTASWDAFYRGQAAEELLWASMGVWDVEDPTDRAAIAKAFAEWQAKQSGETSLAFTRKELARGGAGWKAFAADPFEYTATIVSTSLSQMLPYGVKIIPATTATGTAGGAAAGLAGGPLAPATVSAGAAAGASYGLAVGMAATNFGVEYTNAIIEAMQKRGYDLKDPKQVEEALLNEEVWAEGGEIGLKRGVPIAVVDLLSGGVAGRVFNVAKTATFATKAGAMVAERAIFDPAMEGLGELSAQVMAGQDINWADIADESLGAFGSKTSNMGVNMIREARNKTIQSHAYTLATDMNAMARERSSDERITQWANNLRQLGKIDEDVQQQILKNVGMRREARDVLKPVTGRFGNREVEARMMELMAANEQMTATQNRRMAYKDKISQVKAEISKMAETGQMVPEAERAQIENFAAPTKKAVSKYEINGKVMTREQFLESIGKMDERRMLRSRVNVLNDEETKQEYDAIFKQKTGKVLVREEAGFGEAVEGEVSQARPEEVAGEEVQEERLTPEAANEELVTSKLRLDELNEAIPAPAKRWTSKMTSGTLSEQESASMLSFLAHKVADGSKLSPNQQKAYDANKERVDEMSKMISERNDLNVEVESLTEMVESMGKPKQEPQEVTDADYDITEAFDEEGEVDYAAEEQVRSIAKKRGLGITRDREIAFVARDKEGNVIGGAFRSFDEQAGKYTFDVVVAENAEGKGIGSKLLDAVREVPSDIREFKPKTKVEVDVVNPAMKKMLLKRGYRVVRKLGGDRVIMAPTKPKVKPQPQAEPSKAAGVNVSDKAAIEALSGRVDEDTKRIITQAVRAISILRKVFPDVEVFVHDNADSYNEAMKTEKGRGDSAGNISRRAGNKFRIDINLSLANERTVPHEVAHAMLYKAFGDNPALFKEFRDKVTKMLSAIDRINLKNFASEYSESESHEEFLVELAAIMATEQKNITKSVAQKIATLINRVVERLTGGWVPFKGAVTVNEIVDFLNTFTSVMNEEITEEQQAIEQGLSVPLGGPVEISRSSVSGPKLKFSEKAGELSFVTDKFKIDFASLIEEIAREKKKVWFWMADQLGRGYYFDEKIGENHYLDAGPSFALDPDNIKDGVLWASGVQPKSLNSMSENADYIFFISGSPEASKLFNKSVIDLFIKRIEKNADFETFKNAIIGFSGKETNELKSMRAILEPLKSFEEFRESTKRKEFMVAVEEIKKLKTMPKGSLKELLNGFDIFVDLNELRDSFYRENGFSQNDIMLVGKPSGVGKKAKHSTYLNELLGEVVGVPDIRVNAWSLMPNEIKDKYPGLVGNEDKRQPVITKIVAAEQGKIHEISAPDAVVSKAQVVHDETGFITPESMIQIVASNNPNYLGGVMKHIQTMGQKLRDGLVDSKDVAKSYLISISSIQTGPISASRFINSSGKEVPSLFIESDGKIRPEGAMAFLLTTKEGKKFLENIERNKVSDADVNFFSSAMKPFGFWGQGESKFNSVFGTPGAGQINITNINEFNSLLKGGLTDEQKLFDAIHKLKGISQGKIGFVSNFLGIGTRGVIDTREIKGWLRGAIFQGELSPMEAEITKTLGKSAKKLNDLQVEILKRMEAVGNAFGISPELAGYIGHHMVWDAVANERTTHDGLYLAMTQNEAEYNAKLEEVVSKSQKDMTTEEQVVSMSQQPLGVNTMRGIIKAGRANGYSDAAIKQVLKNKGYKVADINAEMVVNVNPYTLLPTEFADIEGGVKEGLKLYRRTMHKLSQWVTSKGPKGPTEIQKRAMALEILKADPIFRAQDKTTQMKLTVAFDASTGSQVGTRIQRAMDTLISDLKNKQRAIAEKELTAAKVRLRNIVGQMLPGIDVISAKRAEKIMDLIAKATKETLLDDLTKIVKLIEDERSRMRADSIKKLEQILNKKAQKAKTASGKSRSKGLDEVGQEFFQTAKRVYNAIKDEDKTYYDKYVAEVEAATMSGELGELMLRQDAGDTLTASEAELVNAAIALDMFDGLEIGDVEQVNEIIEALETMRGESIKRLKAARLARAEEYRNIGDMAERQVKAMAPELYNQDGSMRDPVQEKSLIRSNILKGRVLAALKKFRERWKYMNVIGIRHFFQQQILHMQAICNSIDDHARGFNFFTDNVYKPINRARELALKGYYKQMATLDAMANSIPGITNGYKQIRRMISDGKVIEVVLGPGVKTVVEDGKKVRKPFAAGGKLNMTKDMMLRVYALSLNETQKKKLENMGFNDDVINKIKDTLGSEPVEFANLLVEYLSEDYFDSVNDVYRFTNNVNLNHVSNFFPTITKPVEVGSKMIEDGDFSGIFNAETSPSLKERVDTTGEVDINFDFTSVVDEYFKSMEWYKSFAWPVKKLNAIFKNKGVDSYLTQLGVKRLLKKQIIFAVNPNAGAQKVSTFASKVATMYTGFALAFKAMQIPKQALSSYWNAFEDYSYFPEGSKVPGVIKGPVDMLMFTLDSAAVMATFPKWLKMAYNESAEFRKRWDDGVDGDIYGLASGARVYVPVDKAMNWKGYARRAYRRSSGMPTMIGDFLGLSSYIVNMRRDMKNGMPLNDAIHKFNDYNATAQSKRESEKSGIQMADNEAARIGFTMFASTSFLQMNKVYMSADNILKSIKAGKVPRGKDIRAFLLNLGLSNALFIAASNMFKLMSGNKDDEEEVLRQMKHAMMGAELLKQLPLLGDAAEAGITQLEILMADSEEEVKKIKKREFRGSGFGSPLASVWKKAGNALKEDDYVNTIRPVFELLLFKAQLDPVIGIYNSFNEGFNEDNMYDILGVSKSYRPTKQEPGKPPKGMSKKDMKRYMPDEYSAIYMDESVMEADEEIKSINKEIEEINREAMDAAFGYEGD